MPRPSPRTLASGLLFLAFLTLYASTAAPGLMFADSGELQAAAITGGIPHATGYPSFVLLGGLFARLSGGNPARGVNLMSSALGALSLALTPAVLGELGVGAGPAAVAAVMFGLSFSPWRIAQRAEVYTLAITLAMLALWRTLVAHRTGRLGDALLAGLLIGLTLTGHLVFALPMAILGLSLAWRWARSGRKPIAGLALLALAFLLGLGPYAATYLADVRHAAINYYDLVRTMMNPSGAPMPDFDTPGKRLLWMLTGHNIYPAAPPPFDPRGIVVRLIEAAVVIGLFEIGPVAVALAALGLAAQWRANSSRAAAMLGSCAASVLFAAWIESGSMIHLFLLPALLVLALLVAAGVESVAVWLHALGGRPAAAAGALALLVAMVVPGPWIRETAEAHPITRWRFQVEEEDASLHAGWIPNLSGFHEAERYGQIASRMIPRDALFVADWGELNVLRYLQAVEGVRRDLTLQQTTPTTLPARLAVWQRDHDLGRRPFVFTRLVPELGRIYAIDESLTVMPGRKLYVQRTPIAAALSRP